MAAARAELSAVGLGRFSLRGVARRLGVAPNALYHHVPDRDGLLDLLLDRLLADVPDTPHAADADPGATVHTIMLGTFDVLAAHPSAVPAYLARHGARGPHAIRLGEIMDAALLAAGVPPVDVPDARRTLIVQAIGFAAFATQDEGAWSVAAGRERFARALGWFLAGLLPDSTGAGGGVHTEATRSPSGARAREQTMTEQQPAGQPDEQHTSLDELNPEGAGATTGAENTFEPEEDEDAPVETDES